jgi:uncharacterized membrane protein
LTHHNVHNPKGRTMSDDVSGLVNVIAVTFEEDSNAYEALTKLKELDSQRQIGMPGGAVVAREENGNVLVKDQVSDESHTGAATGGVIGLLIGILGGPFGVIIGGATGLLVGSLFDDQDDDKTESVLAELSKVIRVGHTAVLAEVSEQSPEVIDTAMAGLGGTVMRRPADEVEAEIAAAEHAQREAKRAARKELLRAHHEKHMEHIREKIAELMAKLHRHKATTPTA